MSTSYYVLRVVDGVGNLPVMLSYVSHANAFLAFSSSELLFPKL